MPLSLNLVQKQTQRLIMTPQMQQSIKLLQMNTLDLEELTQQELLENPFLELEQENTDDNNDWPEKSDSIETSTSSSEELSSHSSISSGSNGASDKSSDDEVAVPASLDDDPNRVNEVDFDVDQYFDGAENYTYTPKEEYEEHSYENYVASVPKLSDHLEDQLRLLELTEAERMMCSVIIGSLNDDGYFKEDSAEVASRMGISDENVLHALSLIQTLDPPGVGARTLQECLQIQLENNGKMTPLIESLLDEHFEMFARHRFKELARKLGCKLADITAAFDEIKHLEPKPGRQFASAPTRYILPDVFVEKVDNDYIVYLNEGDTGNLHLNRSYAQLLRQNNFTPSEKEFAKGKYKAALWFLRNIERRKSTILKIARKIVEFQRDFFDKGIEYLRPLNLRDIAEEIDMHETTVARVTNSKYMQTPRGIFHMKYFFPSGVSTIDGGDASSLAIKHKIMNLIEAEDPRKPLSDQKISNILGQEGIMIARRTVAKYREEIKILPSKLRRKV